MVPKDGMVEGKKHNQSRIEQELGNWQGLQREIYSLSSIGGFSKGPKEGLDPLYLCATIDLRAHVTLEAEVNFVAALTLVDSGATGVFMHPKFAKQCNAILQPKMTP